ncbi:1-acyl-sn-glycerol-3-phosphate acyltransferase [Clostridia bacterium]|nr:1-acyl-sn-glycerol-3-phosphate acyltransferase [Clostridia bacterium]
MFRTLYFYTKLVFSLIAIVPRTFKLRKLQRTMPDNEFRLLTNQIVRKWANARVKDTNATFDMRGLEKIPDCPVVFIANHQSLFDVAPFLTSVNRPVAFIAKIESLKIPVISEFMGYMGCVFMDRADIKQSAKAINEGIAKVKAGVSMVIFPEGTRSKNGNILGEWKAGSFKLATKAKAPIIPVAFYNSFKVMNGTKISAAKVTVIFGDPIITEGLTRDELADFPETIKDIIQYELNELTKNELSQEEKD